MRYHVMIDIETLALTPDALITQIGAVAWDTGTGMIMKTLLLHPSLKDQRSRRIDASTVMWWMGQDDDARKSVIDAHRDLDTQGVHKALEDFLVDVQSQNEGLAAPIIWALGPQFDIVTLENYFGGWGTLWGHRQIADMRTLRLLYDGEALPRAIAHNALEDARAQAQWTYAALQFLAIPAMLRS